MRGDVCIRGILGLTGLLLLGPALAAARSEEARIASEISAAQTLAAENARLSRAALDREFARMDRNLEAANEWVSAQQSEESRRMNEGVARYLKMVHDNEEAERLATEERHRQVEAEREAFLRDMAESARKQREEDAKFAAYMKVRFAEIDAQMRDADRAEVTHAAGAEASAAERLRLLQHMVSQRESYWDQRAADALGPGATARSLFLRVLVRILDQARKPDGTLALSEDERTDLLFVLRASDLRPLAAQVAPEHYCALVIAQPMAFAAHDERGDPAPGAFADLVASLHHVANLQATGATPWADPAVAALLGAIDDGKSTPRNLGEVLELARLLRDDFKRTDDALRLLDRHPLDVYRRPADAGTDRFAGFLFDTLMANRDRLVASSDNFFGDTGAGYVTNCLALQARLAREVDPARLVASAPLTSIPRLQAMLRQFRDRQGSGSAARKRLVAQRGTPEKYTATVADWVSSITRAVDDGALLERNAQFDTIRAEARDPDNPAAEIAALAVLQVVEHPPAWRKTLLPEDRGEVVAAWLWALARANPAQRAPLLARYPALLADPTLAGAAPRLDHRLFLLNADSRWPGLGPTAALLALADQCDPRTGTLPADPGPWLAGLEAALHSDDATVINRLVALLRGAPESAGANAAALRRTARRLLGRLAERDFLEHETAQQAIAANLGALLPSDAELAPGLPLRPEYLRARLTWEKMIADDAAPLDAAHAAIAGLKPGEAVALAFGLKARERPGAKEEPLLLSSDPNFPALILRAVEESTPVADSLWLRLLDKAEPASPMSAAEWTRLRTTGSW